MSRRLNRTNRGSIILPSGELITPRMQKEYKRVMQRANRERQRMLNELPEEVRRQYNMLGASSDYHIRKRGSGFGSLKNLTEFKEHLHAGKDIASGRWENRQINAAYENFQRSLDQTFNSDADYLNALVKHIDKKELKKAMDSGRLENTGYVYHNPSKNYSGKASQYTKKNGIDEASKYDTIRYGLEKLVDPETLIKVQKKFNMI